MVVCFNVLQNKVYARHLGHLSIEAPYIRHICSDTREIVRQHGQREIMEDVEELWSTQKA